MKRTRSDSAESAVKAMTAAALPPLAVPAHVQITEDAKPFWAGIIRARSRDEWIEVDLVIGAQLAQCQADIDAQAKLLREEGSVVVNERGTQVMNPRHSVVEALARREMAIMRTLRFGGKPAGDPRSKAGARKIERESARLRDELSEDPLLAS